MPIRPLDKQTADAVCTIIAIGFMEEQLGIQDPYRRTQFQYEKPEDRDEHRLVRQLIHIHTGLNVEFTRAEPQNDFPFIMTKSPMDNTPEGSIVRAYNNTELFWLFMDYFANQTDKEAPHGAYIGGYAHEVGFALTGPSNLTLYHPCFRSNFNQAEIDSGYRTFLDNILKADFAVYEALRATGSHLAGGINYDPGNISATDNELPPKDQLIGCVHGMIHAMLRYPDPIAQNSVHIEYSLGPNTTKVASCIPCSIFMSANGKPASSTHLGRGDSWNFPNPNIEKYPNMEEQQERWGLKVIGYFMQGKASLDRTNAMNNNRVLNGLWDINAQDNIPQLFLESLTFHGSFTQKIINTLIAGWL